MFPQIEIKHNIGNIISIPNQLEVKVFTYIGTNLPLGTTAIPVDNATEFTSGSILLLLGQMGAENCEFVTASAHTDQGFTTAATKLPKNRGDLVQQVAWDQVVILKSATKNGSYTTFQTQTIQTTQQKTIVFDASGLSTDYYKVQWKNSQTAAVSTASDPISVLAYPVNSVANAVINPVLNAMGISENDSKITTEFLIRSVDDARKYVRMKLFGIRHAWLSEFEFPIQVLSGTNFVTLPTNIDFDESDRSLLAARFLVGNVLAPFNLRYIDKRSWNQISWQLQGGLTMEDISIGATEVSLNSAGDFPAGATSGVAYVATTAFDQVLMQIEYTGVDLTTNKLTGVTGITRDIPEGTQIWSVPSLAQPIYYTVYDGKIWFDRIIPDSMQGTNIYIDFYKIIEEVVNLYQVLDEPYREIYKWYLKYAIKYRKDITTPVSDPDNAKFEGLITDLFNNLYTGQDTTIVTS